MAPSSGCSDYDGSKRGSGQIKSDGGLVQTESGLHGGEVASFPAPLCYEPTQNVAEMNFRSEHAGPTSDPTVVWSDWDVIDNQ